MTSSEEETTAVAAGEGIQQIPVVMNVTEVPAATDARDALLRAIGAEAQPSRTSSRARRPRPCQASPRPTPW
ncbi:hypothetical protein ACIBL5_38755 [Streptomyces sp. NPDC050516]|uniref:hypothetical protein n=1 Tax=Streptomyces sp. NPDC050516 TaxID=3365621 RepID=UPI0037941A10